MSEDRTRVSAIEDGRFRLLIDAVIDYAIYMIDPDGIITSWNAGARRFKGYEEAEILGQHFSRFYTDEDRLAGLPQRALDTAIGEGRFEGEGWRVRKDGTHFWSSTRSSTRPAPCLVSPRSPATSPIAKWPRKPSSKASSSSACWCRA